MRILPGRAQPGAVLGGEGDGAQLAQELRGVLVLIGRQVLLEALGELLAAGLQRLAIHHAAASSGEAFGRIARNMIKWTAQAY